MCKKTAVILICMLMMPLFGANAFAGAAKGGRELSARQAFALIPTEIFENTHSPLSEEEKDQLFANIGLGLSLLILLFWIVLTIMGLL